MSAGEKDEEAQPEEGSATEEARTALLEAHVLAMAVNGVDEVLCLVLFGDWMALCHGFSCVQR